MDSDTASPSRDADVARITRISELVNSGVTLAAVAMVVDLQDDNADLTMPNRDLRSCNTSLTQDNPPPRETKPHR